MVKCLLVEVAWWKGRRCPPEFLVLAILDCCPVGFAQDAGRRPVSMVVCNSGMLDGAVVLCIGGHILGEAGAHSPASGVLCHVGSLPGRSQ